MTEFRRCLPTRPLLELVHGGVHYPWSRVDLDPAPTLLSRIFSQGVTKLIQLRTGTNLIDMNDSHVIPPSSFQPYLLLCCNFDAL